MNVALYSAVLAPVVTIGSWFISPRMWPSFDSVRLTISAMAARGAPSRSVQTSAFVVSGLCYLVTAFALVAIGTPGRVVLAVGGAALIGVALAPLPSPDGTSVAHSRLAGAHFLAMALWPAAGMVTVAGAPWLLTPLGSILASAFLLLLLIVFFVNLSRDTRVVGLTERIVAGAMTILPLVLVLSLG